MNLIEETLVCLFGIFGIIMIMVNLFENKNYTNIVNNSYKIFNKNSVGKPKVEIVIKTQNININEQEKLIKKIMSGEYNNLEEEVDSVEVITI